MQQYLLKGILALSLFTVLVLCFTTKTAFAQQQELEDLQILADQLTFADLNHPSFEGHMEMILADMQMYADDFDIESDDELISYMSTLSDSEAYALAKSSAKFRRFFRRVGRFVGKAARVVGKIAKIAAPIALTVLTSGAAAPALGSLGSFGGAILKGASILSKASSIVGKTQAVLGGLNAVTGGKVSVVVVVVERI